MNAQVLNADVFRFLTAHFPQWSQRVRNLRDEKDEKDFLELTVPDPPGIVHERPLEISTWGEELTISFGEHHRHFSWPRGYDDSDSRETALDFIHAILNEDVLITSVLYDGRCKLSSTVQVHDLKRYHRIAVGDHELRLRSWRCTYDSIIPVDWQAFLEASHS